jgi:hypothetical protein
MVGVPYILFESPEQIWGTQGQEGLRRKLCDIGKSKLIACHYADARDNVDKTLDYTMQALSEVEAGNYSNLMAFNVYPEARSSMERQSKLSLIGA